MTNSWIARVGRSGLVLWALYFAFAASAVVANYGASTFDFSVRYGGLKAAVWLALAGFLVYSIHCTLKENFFRSLRSVASLYWGRQIGIDLYLGLGIGLLLIFFNEGLLVALVWLIPLLVYANLVMLLYIALHFEGIVLKLLGA